MPDAPEKPFDPNAIAREKAADATSKKYRGHPTVTVRQFLKMGWKEQRQVDAECEQLAGDVDRRTIKPPDGPAYVVTTKKPT